MDLNGVLAWFQKKGFAFQWRAEPHAHGLCVLRPSGGQIAMGALEIGIVIPDMHFGVGNDVFRTAALGSPYAARFLGFLQALTELRDEVGAAKFSVVQVGDWYDFFRALAPTVDAQVTAIESQYNDICNLAKALPILHCIGNHDAALYKHPNATTARFGVAQFLGANNIAAYHGHDDVTLETIMDRDLGATVGLNIVNLFAMIPLLGGVIDFAQMVIDESFQETWTKGNTGGDNPWPASSGLPPANWLPAPWIARDDAAALVRAARGLEYLTNTALDIVFVGHSHRPGFASASITADRDVALVDVGSWTYGRAEIAIVTPDGIGLAAIPVT